MPKKMRHASIKRKLEMSRGQMATNAYKSQISQLLPYNNLLDQSRTFLRKMIGTKIAGRQRASRAKSGTDNVQKTHKEHHRRSAEVVPPRRDHRGSSLRIMSRCVPNDRPRRLFAY